MSSDAFQRVGGVRIGNFNATIPFAKLSCNRDELVITTFLVGKRVFRPDQVVSITRYVRIPVIGWGIQIQHTVAEYPDFIVFWTLGDPNGLARQIQEVGFIPQGKNF